MTHSQVFDLALQHLRAGCLEEAEALGRQLLAELSGHPDVLQLLGLIAEQAGQPQAARELLRQAIAANPENPYYHANLGANLADTGQPGEAAAACAQAIRLMPDLAPAHFNLGNARRALGEWDAAVAAYQTALRLQPGNPATLANLGLAWAGKGQLDEAVAAYQAALPGSPNPAAVYNNLGLAFQEQGRLDEAIDCYRRGLALSPGHHGLHSNLVYVAYFHPGYGEEAIAQEHHRWRQQHADPLKGHLRPHRNEPSPDRRLRVGYVSPNFRDHVVGRNLWPLFQQHDRERFELICYADARQPDAFSGRLRALAAQWHETAHLTDEQLASRIREDRIDILVDVTLHMAQNRLATFARKPAPIQVTFAGYPGSTGLETIDYRLTDPYLDPPDRDDARYSEQSIRLPESFWCFDPIEPGPPVNPLPALDCGQFTFGCLNNFTKINERVLAVWSRVLQESPGARLLMLSPLGQVQEHVLAQFARHGVARERLDFAAKRPRSEYLALHHRLDLMLDTFPYTGHSTSLDALWMGVPVVSLAGLSAVSRGGLSILSNVGLPELVASTEADYVRLAVELARDLPRLATLRATLRERLQASPLMDAPRFARNIEAAYRAMWHRWCTQQGALASALR